MQPVALQSTSPTPSARNLESAPVSSSPLGRESGEREALPLSARQTAIQAGAAVNMPPRRAPPSSPRSLLFVAPEVAVAAAQATSTVLGTGIADLFTGLVGSLSPTDVAKPACSDPSHEPGLSASIKQLFMQGEGLKYFVTGMSLGVGLRLMWGNAAMKDVMRQANDGSLDEDSLRIAALLEDIDQGLLNPELTRTQKGREELLAVGMSGKQINEQEKKDQEFARRYNKFFAEMSLRSWPESPDDVDAAMVFFRREAKQLTDDGSFTRAGLLNFRTCTKGQDRELFEARHKQIVAENPQLFPKLVEETPAAAQTQTQLPRLEIIIDRSVITKCRQTILNLSRPKKQLVSLVAAAHHAGIELSVSQVSRALLVNNETTMKFIEELEAASILRRCKPAHAFVANAQELKGMELAEMKFSSNQSGYIFRELPEVWNQLQRGGSLS